MEHPDSGTAVLDKAVDLARRFDARVELLVIQPTDREPRSRRARAALGYPRLTIRAVPSAGEPVHAVLAARSAVSGNPIC